MGDIPFKRTLAIIVTFFVLTPITLASSLYALVLTQKEISNISQKPAQVNSQSVFSAPQQGVQVFASLPNDFPEVKLEIEKKDARAEIIRQYLERYNSPLVGHEQIIVDVADKNGLDFRLIPAIAQQESNLCKIIPPDTFNCWGWGIHSKGTLGFNSYEEAIETVSKGLKEEYIEKGYETPEQIMTKYTPSSPGTWAMGVSSFMAEME